MNQKNKSRRASKHGRPQFLPRSFREWIWTAILVTLFFSGFTFFFTSHKCPMNSSVHFFHPFLITCYFVMIGNSIVTVAAYRKLRKRRIIKPHVFLLTVLLIYQGGLITSAVCSTVYYFKYLF